MCFASMSWLKIAVNIGVHAAFDLELSSFLDVWPGVRLLGGFPGSSAGKESACNAEDSGSIPESGRSLEEDMATHSSILTWRIPWTEEPGRLQSMGLQSWTPLSDFHTSTLFIYSSVSWNVFGRKDGAHSNVKRSFCMYRDGGRHFLATTVCQVLC